MEERISRKRFIRLGAAIGVTTAGASVVAACGGGGGEGGGGATTSSGGAGAGSGETTSDGTTGGATEMGGSGGEVIAETSAVAENSATAFTDGGDPALLVHLPGGDFVAYSAVCTHQQCEVAYQPETSEIACPCHGSIFDPASGGQVVNGPAEQPLPEIPVQVQGDRVVKA